jgi:hypothetical protein
MNKVYQTIIGSNKSEVRGNCMQAAIASLFEMELNDVPNFIEYDSNWFDEMYKFLQENGYEYNGTLYNYKKFQLESDEPLDVDADEWNKKLERIKDMDGIDGLFFASVLSPKYYVKEDLPHCTHAVIIDKNFNIVHDVNKGYVDIEKYPESDFLGYNGIIDVWLIEKQK